MTKIVILNGPPRCGKDYAATALLKLLSDDDAVHMKLSAPLKQIASTILATDSTILEKNKDTVLPFGMSYRDVQITVFATLAKTFGPDWLGRSLVSRIKNSDNDTIIVSDGGREEEIVPLVRAFGASNILIVQIVKDGCTFDYDIRGYINNVGLNRTTVYNDGTANYILKVQDIVLAFLN